MFLSLLFSRNTRKGSHTPVYDTLCVWWHGGVLALARLGPVSSDAKTVNFGDGFHFIRRQMVRWKRVHTYESGSTQGEEAALFDLLYIYVDEKFPFGIHRSTI